MHGRFSNIGGTCRGCLLPKSTPMRWIATIRVEKGGRGVGRGEERKQAKELVGEREERIGEKD